MSFRMRIYFNKAWLRGSERAFFLIGFVLLGFCAVILGRAWISQIYENWAFEQELRGQPVSYARFIADTLSPPAAAPEPPAPVPVRAPAPMGRPKPELVFDAGGDRSIVGRMEIPRIGLRAMIREGVSHRTLALAVGHIPGTALPGGQGNVGIAGHRDTFFRSLREVKAGDAIILATLEGSYEYRVESTEVVAPRDTRVLESSSRPELTLVTCYPFYFVGPAPERFIVHATRVAGD